SLCWVCSCSGYWALRCFTSRARSWIEARIAAGPCLCATHRRARRLGSFDRTPLGLVASSLPRPRLQGSPDGTGAPLALGWSTLLLEALELPPPPVDPPFHPRRLESSRRRG